MAAQKKVRSVCAAETTLEIINGLLHFGGEAGVTELADHLSMTKSTVYKHLQTQTQRGFVVKFDGKYRLSFSLSRFSHCLRHYKDLFPTAQPEVDKLAEETDELANLMIEEDGRGIYLYTARGSQAVSLDTVPGKQMPLHATGLGKAILSAMPDERVSDIVDQHGLSKITEHTITTREELFEELNEIREVGCAFDLEERVIGTRCVAAPVTTNGLHAAVSVTGPASRMQDERLEGELMEAVKQAANVTDINLSYQRP